MTQTPTAFVVLTSPRSGSTWLVQTLNRQPGVTAFGELFLADPTRSWGAAGVPPYDAFRSAHGGQPRAVRYLRGVLDRPDDLAVGFKLMYGQARRHPVLWAYLIARRARVVHLVRENSVDVAISRQAAIQTGRFHAAAGEQSESRAVWVDPEQLVHDIRTHRRWVSVTRRLGQAGALPWLEVRYESLVLDGPRELGRIGEFLSVRVEPAERRSDSLERSGGAGGHRIENAEEVRAAVIAAGYSSLLAAR